MARAWENLKALPVPFIACWPMPGCPSLDEYMGRSCNMLGVCLGTGVMLSAADPKGSCMLHMQLKAVHCVKRACGGNALCKQ